MSGSRLGVDAVGGGQSGAGYVHRAVVAAWDARLARDYRGAGWIGSDPDALVGILRIANAIGNAAAQSSAMAQNARGPSAP
jgi:hypothetical protein